MNCPLHFTTEFAFCYGLEDQRAVNIAPRSCLLQLVQRSGEASVPKRSRKKNHSRLREEWKRKLSMQDSAFSSSADPAEQIHPQHTEWAHLAVLFALVQQQS
ncbi:uncharacterized protein MONOS_5593 [Monocercomonoides exilis]|uniref:uncharacterized protein n=1 Tax=Monocercomonoides exilis TaxID=2049356 RepID=UPI00355A62F8|nr:hypothetical protein MONOS_5593 [Monocercomonoides exilis]|eukprot:MONOS_5593.1-p1 / transcript=MONOS_5593.1 / gene=MONOS_5593 / organism=Monocercomonoides_exilis_PA203 / gene_product=unspecified product / transcript_product=unspecified product / location=Mono_scaffold00164:93035-93340(-) / protein_length=102 / sequence_SO=supercontig / SO=protein_coding / is_pseudo=false